MTRLAANEMGFAVGDGSEAHLRANDNEPGSKLGSCYLENNHGAPALKWRVKNKLKTSLNSQHRSQSLSQHFCWRLMGVGEHERQSREELTSEETHVLQVRKLRPRGVRGD